LDRAFSGKRRRRQQGGHEKAGSGGDPAFKTNYPNFGRMGNFRKIRCPSGFLGFGLNGDYVGFILLHLDPPVQGPAFDDEKFFCEDFP